MFKLNNKIIKIDRFSAIRSIVLFFMIALISLPLTSCSKEESNGLAVSKMSEIEIQQTDFLPLNQDMPGTPVDAQRYLVPGKFTIVAYLSPYDETCVNLEPQLIRLIESRDDIAVRTVNINRPEVEAIDWNSPIMKEELITKLPYFRIYDKRFNLRAQARPAYEGVMQWIGELPPQIEEESEQIQEVPEQTLEESQL